MPYTISIRTIPEKSRIIIVGCGGTGSFVAEGICRLPITERIPLLLIDPDRVEEHNLMRQQFYKSDLGKFKSQVLAERLARLYGRPIAYSVYPFMPDLREQIYGDNMYSLSIQGLIIGCVDNAAARQSIASGLHFGNWWIDIGNGYSSGQVLIGNTTHIESIHNCFYDDKVVDSLPAPSLQLPSLLIPVASTEVKKDCAESVIDEDQSPVINQVMAVLALQFVDMLLRDKLTWMGAYIDMEAGTLHTVPADPVTVARMLGVKVDTLMATNKQILEVNNAW